MAYPNFDGVVKSVETCARNSPIIQGVGVFGLTHDYGVLGDVCNIDFTFGHFQQLTLSQSATFTLLTPPGTFDMLLKITHTGISQFVDWSPLLECPMADHDALTTLTVPDAVDIVRLHYAKRPDNANFYWWATSYAKNIGKAPVSIAVTTVINPVDPLQYSQCTATATYSDATTRNITTSCVWASSDATKVSISATTGRMRGVAVGPSNITATCGTIVGTLAVACH